MKVKKKMLYTPNNLVVVLPAAVIASLVWPTVGNLVHTILCAPILPKVYTFDSPITNSSYLFFIFLRTLEFMFPSILDLRMIHCALCGYQQSRTEPVLFVIT